MNVVLRKQLETVPEDVRARILLASNLGNSGEADEAIRICRPPWRCGLTMGTRCTTRRYPMVA